MPLGNTRQLLLFDCKCCDGYFSSLGLVCDTSTGRMAFSKGVSWPSLLWQRS